MHLIWGLSRKMRCADAFDERHRAVEHLTAEPAREYFVREEKARYEVLEDRDEYTAENIFWVPSGARWSYLQARAKW
jgi:type I restriction enzyme M protein